MSSTVGLRIAQAIGCTGAAWLSGNIAVFSINVIPSLLRSRTETNISMAALAKQWREIYESGKRQNPPIAFLTAASFIYLAVVSSRNKLSPLLVFGAPYSRAGFYASAALLTLGIMPFTFVAMTSTNDALIRVSDTPSQGASAGAAATDPEIEKHLRDWVSSNRTRSLFPLIASLTGIAAALL
ncbi:hypothetical protein ASPVEDRAFT_41545 [Aspergillus versicolor CBS 583.65]|uniref:DUF1772 domain-containing protein n=1 Tax=Aspergillus versicolor CBS 583.65 TaxID=1036611 RepID=A0A1L9PKH0_ASPVE|nr:uncharacterized protein ASPVEDRAFT_41545 [Aspergillus versicolor CBS 583.65]OJJ02024.1 hypothetical protein ASPVEDRAFT_41545 [Aspergillus versicolor CBS 583.65]